MSYLKLVLYSFTVLCMSVQAFDYAVDHEISVAEFKNLIEDKNIEKVEFPALASREALDGDRKGSKVYFLFGYLEQKFTNYEYSHALSAIRALQNAGWSVAADGSTSKREFQSYVEDDQLAAFFWSSHGTKEGYLTALNSNGQIEGVSPSDFKSAGSNLKLGVTCACYSAVLLNDFSAHWNHAAVYGYTGLTTPQNCAALLQYQFIPLFNKHVN